MMAQVKGYPILSKWPGAYPCLMVLAAASAVFLLLSYLAYSTGKQEEDERLYLVNYREPNVDEILTGLSMNYILNSSEYNDVLIHGDSTSRIDIDVAQFGAATGLKAFGIGTSAWLGWSSYSLLLEKYLENHPKPRAVLFCVYPDTLMEIPPGGEGVEEHLIWCYGPGSEETRPVHAYPYIHYTREGLRTLYGNLSTRIGITREKFHLQQGKEFDRLIGEWTTRRGSTLKDGLTNEKHAPDPWDASAGILPKALRHLDLMASSTQKLGILFVVRIMPAWKGRITFSPTARQQLSDLEKRHENTVVCRPEVWEYDGDYFFDHCHLNSSGAALATLVLAAEFESILKARGLNFRDQQGIGANRPIR